MDGPSKIPAERDILSSDNFSFSLRCLLSCCLTHWQSGKVSEMNRDASHWKQSVCKAKKSGNLHLIATRTRAKWWWLSCAEIPAILAAFCGNSVYIDFDITTPPAWETEQLKEKWSGFSLFCLLVFFLHPSLTDLIHCFSVFSSILVGALSYLSLGLPPHQKIPFPSENGNFTIFAAYQSNSRGGEMEMWK